MAVPSTDAYPQYQVDYFWKQRDSRGIIIIEDEENEFTLKNITTKRTIVQYGTSESCKSGVSLFI